MKTDRKPSLIVIILTLDEEANIAKAIRSVGDRASVLVLDSGSNDRTTAIAEELGAIVRHLPFVDYATSRNHALELVEDNHDWVFFLDADEEFTTELWNEVEQAIRADDVDGAYVGYSFVVLERELRHGGFGGASVLRLMRPKLARFSRGTNERVDDSQLRVRTLRSKFRHADAKPLATWFRKHVRYAEREARHFVDGDDKARGLTGFGLRTKAARMVGIRWAYNQLPLFVRPFANFGRAVVAQSAWRDGIPGLMFAGMQALWYPMMIDLFIYEAQRANQEKPDA